MQLLAVETSSDACSVALYQDGAVLVREAVIPKQHSQQLLPMIEALLAEAQSSLTACDAIAFGRGPGSFTGVRMAAGVAQGLAFGIDVPVIPISTLAAVAWAARHVNPQAYFVATLDARMQELYWAVYQLSTTTGLVETHSESVQAYSSLVTFLIETSLEPLVICGPGWPVYAPIDESRWLTCAPAWPSAGAVAELAALNWSTRLKPVEGLPTYIRDNVAIAAPIK